MPWSTLQAMGKHPLGTSHPNLHISVKHRIAYLEICTQIFFYSFHNGTLCTTAVKCLLVLLLAVVRAGQIQNTVSNTGMRFSSFLLTFKPKYCVPYN